MIMSVLFQVTRIAFLVTVICGAACADAHPSHSSRAIESDAVERRDDQVASEIKSENRALPRLGMLTPGVAVHSQEYIVRFPEPFALQAMPAPGNEVSEVSAKWAE